MHPGASGRESGIGGPARCDRASGQDADPAASFGVAEGRGLGWRAKGSFTHPANTAAGLNRSFSVFVDAPATNPI